MNKTLLYLIYFCVYSAMLLVVGKGGLKGDNTLQGYFACHRQVSLPMSIATFVGTWVSAITILSLTGSIYKDGLSVLLYAVVPWFFGGLLLATIAKRLHAANVISVPELFYSRYHSRGLQIVYGILFILVYIFYLVAQYKGFGMVASELFDIPYPIAVLMVYLFIMYTTFGGYRSVLRTDMFHLILLIISLSILAISMVCRVGGFGALYGQAREISGLTYQGLEPSTNPAQLLSLFGGQYTPLISLSMFWSWGLGVAANPQYVVRIMATPNERNARKTVLYSLPILAFLYFALVQIGLGMRVLVPSLQGIETTDGIILQLINNQLYGPWSGFFLFSVLGACISTANSQLLMVASSFSYDVVRGITRDSIPERKVLSLGRLSVILGGTLAMVMSLNPPDFTLSYGADIWGLLSVLLFPPMYGTLLSPRITLRGIWACILAGAFSVAVCYPLYYLGMLPVHPAMPGVIFSTAAMLAVSFSGRKQGVTT